MANTGAGSGTVAFFVCVAGIYSMYLTYGYVQEAMYRAQPDGTKFTATWLLLAIQCAANAGVGILAHFISTAVSGAPSKPKAGTVSVWSAASQQTFASIAFTYLAAMTCSTEAIAFVSYPTMALVKSCKMIPVMLARVLYLGKRYSWLKYACVVTMAAGIAMFQLMRINAKAAARGASDSPEEETDWSVTAIGYTLLFASLSFDALTGPRQEALQATVGTTSVLFMGIQNAWAVLYAGIAAVATGQAVSGMAYLGAHPGLWGPMALFALTSALGQLFIFYTVLTFDSLVLTTVTTTRKFFTILVSVLAHGHALSATQWGAVGVVFSAIIADKFGPAFLGITAHPPARTAEQLGAETPHAEDTLSAAEHAGAVDLHHLEGGTGGGVRPRHPKGD